MSLDRIAVVRVDTHDRLQVQPMTMGSWALCRGKAIAETNPGSSWSDINDQGMAFPDCVYKDGRGLSGATDTENDFRSLLNPQPRPLR